MVHKKYVDMDLFRRLYYDEEMSLQACAEEMNRLGHDGLTAQLLHRRANSEGWELRDYAKAQHFAYLHKRRDTTQPRQEIDIETAIELYESGMSYRSVAERLGVSSYVLRERLLDADYELRPRGPIPKSD